MRDGTCCCSYCVGAYDHAPDAPDHRAAYSGCTGTGGDAVWATWLWTDVHGWRLWTDSGECRASNGLRRPSGCTAYDAVREGVKR